MFETQIIITIVVVAAIFVFRVVLGRLLKSKLKRLVGYQRLSNFLTAIFTIVIALYLLNVWGGNPSDNRIAPGLWRHYGGPAVRC